MPEIVVHWVENGGRRYMLPDLDQFDKSVRVLHAKAAQAADDERKEIEETIEDIKKAKRDLVSAIEKARQDGTLTEKRYRYHVYTGKERIQASKEATTWEGGLKHFDELTFQAEIVDLTVENLVEVEGTNAGAASLPAKLLDRLYYPIRDASEAGDDQLFFTGEWLPTCGTRTPSSSAPTNSSLPTSSTATDSE